MTRRGIDCDHRQFHFVTIIITYKLPHTQIHFNMSVAQQTKLMCYTCLLVSASKTLCFNSVLLADPNKHVLHMSFVCWVVLGTMGITCLWCTSECAASYCSWNNIHNAMSTKHLSFNGTQSLEHIVQVN